MPHNCEIWDKIVLLILLISGNLYKFSIVNILGMNK